MNGPPAESWGGPQETLEPLRLLATPTARARGDERNTKECCESGKVGSKVARLRDALTSVLEASAATTYDCVVVGATTM